MKVEEVRLGVLDAAGAPISAVYVKNAPRYAIYATDERVVVHFADDPEVMRAQQEVLAPLSPLRGEINALIDGWGVGGDQDKEDKTRLFNRRIADALAIALEGDSATAHALMKSSLEEILEEQQSPGRIAHLYFAVATTAAIGILAAIIFWLRNRGVDAGLERNSNALLFAGAVGAFGALVSIAIAVRDRALAADLQPRDNMVDAVLRVTVGAVGAVLLIAMLRSDLLDIEVGGVDLGGNERTPAELVPAQDQTPAAAAGGNVVAPAPEQPGAASERAPVAAPADRQAESLLVDRRSKDALILLIIAFFAGFTERLVNQLAERIRFRDVAVGGAVAASAAAAQSRGPAGGGGAGGGTAPARKPDETPVGEEEATDGCLADQVIAADAITDDTQLPAATGGVEEPAPGTAP